MLGKPATRWHAFLIHLALSAIIFIGLASIIVLFWYPGFLFKTDGGWQGIRLIAGIDLVLGPLLTLLVYNPSKKSLTFDLSCIALVQLLALGYGTHLVYQQRPIAVIFADGQFQTASTGSFDFHNIDVNQVDIIRDNPKPVWIWVELPPTLFNESNIDRNLRIGSAHFWVEGYRHYRENIQYLKEFGQEQVDDLPKTDANTRYYSLLSRYNTGYITVNIDNGKSIATYLKDLDDLFQRKSTTLDNSK